MAWLPALLADQAAAVPLAGVGRLAPAAPSWWRIGAMLAVLGLLLYVWWKVNRGQLGQLGPLGRLGLGGLLKPAAPRLVLGEQRWLNGRTVVCVVEIDGERFLLAQSPGALAWQPLAKAPAQAPTDLPS